MPTVLALFAHPDDIEFHASGTLLQLGRRGWDLHYCNISSGNLGSTTTPPAKTATLRKAEARASAKILGATWHPPFCHDLQVFYTDENIRRVCALIRAVQLRNADMVRILMRAGANPDRRDAVAGLSAREYAAQDGRASAILGIIERGGKAEEPKKPAELDFSGIGEAK